MVLWPADELVRYPRIRKVVHNSTRRINIARSVTIPIAINLIPS